MKGLRGIVGLLIAATGGCAIERSQIAHNAADTMMGMSTEKVLACMGAPANKAAAGQTEVWTYVSSPQTEPGGRFCNVSVVMTGGRVSRVNFNGATGGLLSPDEQCAFAVQHCA